MRKNKKLTAFLLKSGRPLLLFFAAVLLASCQPVEGLRPFAVAVVCLFWKDKYSYLPVCAGAFIAALLWDFSFYSLALNVLPCILLSAFLNFLRVKKADKPWLRMAALFCAQAFGMLPVEMAEYDIIMTVLSVLCGCAFLPIADVAVNLLEHSHERSQLSRGELCCINGVACAILVSLPKEGVLGISPMLLISCAYMCIASQMGPVGVSVGCSLGVLFIIRGVPVETAMAFCASAALSSLLRGLKRFGAPLGMLAGTVLVTLAIRRDLQLLIPLQNLLLAALPVMLLKSRQLEALRGAAGLIRTPSSSERTLARRSLEEIEQRLKRTAAVFNRVSEIFAEGGDDIKERKNRLCADAAEKICGECESRDYCWQSRGSDTSANFRELSGMVAALGTVSPYDVSEDFRVRCPEWVRVLVRMNTRNSEMPPMRRSGRGELMARQCRSISDMLMQLFNENNPAVTYDADDEARITGRLAEEGIRSKEIVCRRRDGILESVTVSRPACRGERNCTELICSALSECLGCEMQCDSKFCNCSGGTCVCVYTPVPTLRITCHAARKNKEGEKICGDSFAMTPLAGGKYLAAISDGMGSGVAAARESERAVSLLEALFAGGMDCTAVYSTLNELLRIKEDESFSTLDACVIDLQGGSLSWGKIGAVPGYFVRSGRVQAIEGESLPLGIVSRITPTVTSRMIRRGDIIVLVSDGVYDALVRGNSDGISAVLPELCNGEPSGVAEGLLRAALLASGGHARDDMTALAVKIGA